MRFETGKTYGGYEFLDTLGSSKTVLSYRVRNVLAQRVELLRILPQMLGGDQERTERFLREMRVRARVTHPNIVAFYHAGELEGQLIMTTELVEGPTLAERLELGPIPCSEAMTMITQVLGALGCMHANKIVHREVAPNNIILTPDKIVKLSGFGLAKATTDWGQLTRVGAVMGDPKYMPPEQVRGLITLDGRSDVYSVGAVLYEAITGSAPFAAEGQFDLMRAQIGTMPQPPSELQSDIPAGLDSIVLTAMAKEPAQRFQSAEEFCEALSNLASAWPGPAESSVTNAPEPRPQAAAVVPVSNGAPAVPQPAVFDNHITLPNRQLEAVLQPPAPFSWSWNWSSLLFAGVLMFLVFTVTFLAYLTLSQS